MVISVLPPLSTTVQLGLYTSFPAGVKEGLGQLPGIVTVSWAP